MSAKKRDRDRPKKRAIRAWIDMKGNQWGVEVDAPELTCDGHFVCVVPNRKDADEDHERSIAQMIADAINGRRLPKVDNRD